jgi:hypothetical protein
VFTWWVTRPEPLSIGYVISTTSTGADATTKSLVPGLTLRPGTKDIPAIHTHVISVSRTSGYADDIAFAATFSQNVEVFGSAFDAPSPVHTITCETIPNGTKCKLGPMDGQGEYRLSLATDSPMPPRLAVAGRDVHLASLSEIASRRWTVQNFPELFSMVALTLTAVLMGSVVFAQGVSKLFGVRRRVNPRGSRSVRRSEDERDGSH